MGVDLHSNWRRRHLLVFPIKGRALSLCSIPLLLHAESEIAPSCEEIGLSLWCGNWTSDWCAVLTRPNWISDLVALLPPNLTSPLPLYSRGRSTYPVDKLAEKIGTED